MKNKDAINCEEMLFLDAEELAEQGMSNAYEEIKAVFQKRGIELSPIKEIINSEKGTYHVTHMGKKYCIYEDGNDQNSWANATVVLFNIVNSQIQEYDLRLYAINGGNDLGGVILNKSDFVKAANDLRIRPIGLIFQNTVTNGWLSLIKAIEAGWNCR